MSETDTTTLANDLVALAMFIDSTADFDWVQKRFDLPTDKATNALQHKLEKLSDAINAIRPFQLFKLIQAAKGEGDE